MDGTHPALSKQKKAQALEAAATRGKDTARVQTYMKETWDLSPSLAREYLKKKGIQAPEVSSPYASHPRRANPSSTGTYLLELDDEAEIIGSSISAAGGKNLQANDKSSLELALELIRSRVSTVKLEAGDDGELLAQEEYKMLPVSRLTYTQKSISRQFADGGQFGKLRRDVL